MGLTNIFLSILPVFMLMALGALARSLGYLPRESVPTLNRLTYYMAIPVMIFLEISKSSLGTDLNVLSMASSCLAILPVAFLAYATGRAIKLSGPTMGSFIQSSIHGNLGYLGLAISFYVMGSKGLIKASILAGFVIIVQNFISIGALIYFSKRPDKSHRVRGFLRDIALNPIILAAFTGILFSGLQLQLPGFVRETMQLLSRMALPLALLVIGASLSFGLFNQYLLPTLLTIPIKLLLLPLTGLLLFRLMGGGDSDLMPAIILLGSPTATVSYVMASEMGGDTRLATTAISSCTAMSILTYTVWVWLLK